MCIPCPGRANIRKRCLKDSKKDIHGLSDFAGVVCRKNAHDGLLDLGPLMRPEDLIVSPVLTQFLYLLRSYYRKNTMFKGTVSKKITPALKRLNSHTLRPRSYKIIEILVFQKSAYPFHLNHVKGTLLMDHSGIKTLKNDIFCISQLIRSSRRRVGKKLMRVDCFSSVLGQLG